MNISPTASEPDSRTSSATRFTLSVVLVAVLMTASLITRLIVLGLASHDLRASGGEIAKALVVGELFDGLTALWVAAPLVLISALLPEGWWHRAFVRGWMRTWLFVLFALATFAVAAEVLFFDEFTGRFNFVAVDYLIYPTEVVTNL
ncbi:MAG: hypothetical protein ABIT38_03305 [Gemmatimonadaceae bacterium]